MCSAQDMTAAWDVRFGIFESMATISPLDILARFPTVGCPVPNAGNSCRKFSAGNSVPASDYENIDSLRIYYEFDTCCLESMLVAKVAKSK
jgi:hypothetical protein